MQDEPSTLEESIIQTIVTKLGYTSEEIRRYVKDENSFVSVLYHKLIEENRGNHPSRSTNSFSAKSAIQPSYVQSISSSLNQSNMS